MIKQYPVSGDKYKSENNDQALTAEYREKKKEQHDK
jgi:hypothetical protein